VQTANLAKDMGGMPSELLDFRLGSPGLKAWGTVLVVCVGASAPSMRLSQQRAKALEVPGNVSVPRPEGLG